jgi:hypothetical protein
MVIEHLEQSITEQHPWYSEHRYQRRLLDAFGQGHHGRNRLLLILLQAAKGGGNPKVVYRRAVQTLIEQHAAKQRGKAKRIEELGQLLDLLKAAPKAVYDLCRNQIEWCALAPEERQAISLARRRAYELQNVPRCLTCGDPVYFLVSQQTGQCVRCRSKLA